MDEKDTIRIAFEACLLAEGWRIVSVRLLVQACSHQCGPWAHWFRSRFNAYVSDSTLVGTRTFPDFLRSSPDIVDMEACETPYARRKAGVHNSGFIATERARVRGLLHQAMVARPANLHSCAVLDDFLLEPSGVIDISMDEELAGDGDTDAT